MSPLLDTTAPDAPRTIVVNTQRWVDEFVKGPRGRTAPPLPQDSELDRRTRGQALRRDHESH